MISIKPNQQKQNNRYNLNDDHVCIERKIFVENETKCDNLSRDVNNVKRVNNV